MSEPTTTSTNNSSADELACKSMYRFTLELTLEAPVLTQSVNARPIGVDTAMQFYKDMPALSGSLIAGNLRHTLNEFMTLFNQQAKQTAAEQAHFLELESLIKNGFGTESHTEDLRPERRRIQFDNYWMLTKVDGKPASPEDIQHDIQTRIEIDPETGTVKKNALNVIETLFKSGTQLTFSGGISLLFDTPKADHEAQLQGTLNWLSKALSYLTALGANKGVGFGRIKTFVFPHKEQEQEQGIHFHDLVKASPLPHIPERVHFKLIPKEPFCLAKPHTPNSNRFEAEEIISGGVIRGCLARFLSKKQLDQMGFADWIVTHAKPVDSTQYQRFIRDLPLPLSLAYLGQQTLQQPPAQRFADLINHPPGRVTLEDTDKKVIPAFASDWKDSVRTLARKKWGIQTSYERMLRVQTALNSRFSDNDAMQATDEQLFSMELIHPQNDIWLGEIDLSQLSLQARQFAYGLLTALADKELIGLGKTDSRFSLALFDEGDHPTSVSPNGQGSYRIQLATEARLLTHQQASQIPNTMGSAALTSAYAHYWLEQSKHSLALKTHFSRQRLVGGHYYHQRFLRAKAYQPVWLCEAGSVFELTPIAGKEAQAAETIAQWVKLGLPQPDGNTSWEHNPWIRENGFGEIAVNRMDLEANIQYAVSVEEQSKEECEEQHNGQA